MSPRKATLLVAIATAYIALAWIEARARAPFCDEGWFASPGLNLLRHGSLETSVYEPAGSWLKGIDRHTYWIMPLWSVGLAGWYKLLGFGLFAMRSFSIVWGLLALAMVFTVARRLLERDSVALFAVALLAFDPQWLFNSELGRMDVMAAALVYGAFAAYLTLREPSLIAACVSANVLLCAAMLTHPNGVLGLPPLLLLVFTYDRARFRWKIAALALIPYLIGFGMFALYAAHDPHAFVAQFFGNAKFDERAMIVHAPLHSLWREIAHRYLDSYGWTEGGWNRLRVLTLIIYVFGALGPLFIASLRASRGAMTLLRMLLLMAGGLFLIDGIKHFFYLVYVLPLFAILTALTLDTLARRGAWARSLSAAVAVFLIASGASSAFAIARQDEYHRVWLPMVSFVQQRATPRSIVMGPSELGFALGYGPPLIDDIRLGYYTGKQPDLIVTDPVDVAQMDDLQTYNKLAFQFVRSTLASRYKPVFTSGTYIVYARR